MTFTKITTMIFLLISLCSPLFGKLHVRKTSNLILIFIVIIVYRDPRWTLRPIEGIQWKLYEWVAPDDHAAFRIGSHPFAHLET